jgi:hypothetical protein
MLSFNSLEEKINMKYNHVSFHLLLKSVQHRQCTSIIISAYTEFTSLVKSPNLNSNVWPTCGFHHFTLSYEFPYSYKKFSFKTSAKLSLLNILRIREGHTTFTKKRSLVQTSMLLRRVTSHCNWRRACCTFLDIRSCTGSYSRAKHYEERS